VEHCVRTKLTQQFNTELNGPVLKESLVAGALCMALTYVNRYLNEVEGRKARILVLTASGAAAAHYMNYMNAFFTAQKLGVPIDACVLERDSGLLQQGADITGIIYTRRMEWNATLRVFIKKIC
jgi:hypothetical protein